MNRLPASDLFLPSGALFALLSVAAGAFGAHGLRATLEPRMLEIFATAAQYQMYHALALIVVGMLLRSCDYKPRLLLVAGWSFIVGILVFSGSLYCLAVFNSPRLGMITPIGGLSFMLGWAALFVASIRKSV